MANPFDQYYESDTAAGDLARASLDKPALIGETPVDTYKRQQTDALIADRNRLQQERIDNADASLAYRQQRDQARGQTGSSLTGSRTSLQQNRTNAADFASRGVPTYNTDYGDSIGNPQKITPQATGSPILSDPFDSASDVTDKRTGDQYKVAPGLPWKWTGVDSDIQNANKQKEETKNLNAVASALGSKLSLDQHAAVVSAQDFKNQKKKFDAIAQRGGIFPDTEIGMGLATSIDAGDVDATNNLIDAHFNNLKTGQEATDTKGWFSSELTPEAKQIQTQIDLNRNQTKDLAGKVIASKVRNDTSTKVVTATRLAADSAAFDRSNAALVQAGLPPLQKSAVESVQEDVTSTPVVPSATGQTPGDEATPLPDVEKMPCE